MWSCPKVLKKSELVSMGRPAAMGSRTNMRGSGRLRTLFVLYDLLYCETGYLGQGCDKICHIRIVRSRSREQSRLRAQVHTGQDGQFQKNHVHHTKRPGSGQQHRFTRVNHAICLKYVIYLIPHICPRT